MGDREILEQILNNQISMKNDMDILKNKVESIENRLISVEERLTKTKDKITDIEIYLENVIERNIRTLAEGHKHLNENVTQVFCKLDTMWNDYEILRILDGAEHKLSKIV